MKDVIFMFMEKVLDLANYLLTGLIVAYYFEPMKNGSHGQIFATALLVILAFYVFVGILGFVVGRRNSCTRGKK